MLIPPQLALPLKVLPSFLAVTFVRGLIDIRHHHQVMRSLGSSI